MKQQGFTLIELIIVIVILGILAVTAAPRFIDIQSDARTETLQGVKAAIQGASQLVYAKAAIAGVQNAETATVEISGETVNITYGYPNADLTTAAEMQKFVDVELTATTASADLALDEGTASDGIITVGFASIAIGTDDDGDPTGCYIQYTNPQDQGDTPTFTVVSTDC